MSRAAVFFVYVWPEPRSSAAGVRTWELIEILQQDGWACAAVSPSGAGPWREALEEKGVRTFSADPNDSAAAHAALAAVGDASLVVYDRFVMEEQFGWRARGAWPSAFHVVDTQDLHSLRRARERLVGAGAVPERILEPRAEDMGEDLVRELSSLYRADGGLVVSSFERDWLNAAGYPYAGLVPFSAAVNESAPGFADRRGFCFLGNYRHPPNLDAVRFCVSHLWPAVRSRLPAAELHLYGAYPPAEVSRHRGEHGIFAHGPVTDHRAALSRHRALLAPLRYGAGIKGKVLEAWGAGTPVVGSRFAFEGIGGGVVAETPEHFAAACARLDGEEGYWDASAQNAKALLAHDFSRARVRRDFLSFVNTGISQLADRRGANLVGQMLRHHATNSTKYFSRWIEAKRRV